MSNERTLFKPGTVYHVYNHGNADDNIFREKENYFYFLKRYAHYIYPVAKTYAFCLLPNHFHFAVKIRAEKILVDFFRDEGKDLAGFENLPGLISKQFSNFLNSYTKSYNNKYNRKGKLFLKSLERKPIDNQTYYTRLIYYIHQNPVHHGFVKRTADWPFSSYSIMLSRKVTRIERSEVLTWFGDKKGFVKFHQQDQEINRNEFY